MIKRVAVVNEVSARDKNPYIVEAFKKQGLEVFNIGMKDGEYANELTYIQTGLMAAIIINLDVVDLVVGGCGTGLGFNMSVMEYPNVSCGLVGTPLDAFLYGIINGGNCISLPLNKGFGWAGDLNLDYIAEKLLIAPFGQGYPKNRESSQRESRKVLEGISKITHKTMEEIIDSLNKDVMGNMFLFEEFVKLIKDKNAKNREFQSYLIRKFHL